MLTTLAALGAAGMALYFLVVLTLGFTWFGVQLSDTGRERAAAVIDVGTALSVVAFTILLWRIEASRERVAFVLRQVEGLSSRPSVRQLRVWFRIDNTGGRPVSFPAARCHIVVSDPKGTAVRIKADSLAFVAGHRSTQAAPAEFGCLSVPAGEFRFAMATVKLDRPLLVAKGILELQSTAGKTEEQGFEAGVV